MARTRKVNVAEDDGREDVVSSKSGKKDEKQKGKIKKAKKKGEYPSYERFIFKVMFNGNVTCDVNNNAMSFFKVLKQTHAGISISSKAMSIMNSFVIDIFERIANESATLVAYRKSNQLTQREINTACKLMMTGEIRDISINEGEKALALYNESLKTKKQSSQ